MRAEQAPSSPVADAAALLREKRGDEQVTFGDVADHLVDFAERNPDEAAAVARLARFLARVEDVLHDHERDRDRGLRPPAAA